MKFFKKAVSMCLVLTMLLSIWGWNSEVVTAKDKVVDTNKPLVCEKLKVGMKASVENTYILATVEVVEVKGNMESATFKATYTSKQCDIAYVKIESEFNGSTVIEERKDATQAGEREMSFTFTVQFKNNSNYHKKGDMNILTTWVEMFDTEGVSHYYYRPEEPLKVVFAPASNGSSEGIDLTGLTSKAATFDNTSKGIITYWKKGSSTKKEVPANKKNFKLTGLSAGTTYQYYYQEKMKYTYSGTKASTTLLGDKTKTATFTTASGEMPKVASIQIKNARNTDFGYTDIWGVWHKTGTAAIGTVVVKFKKTPKDKYAMIFNDGPKYAKIKGKIATFKKVQFTRGSRVGGTAKVRVATASCLNKLRIAIGISKKTKAKNVRIH